VAGEGVVVVGLGHWFNELGLRVSFWDASSSFFARWFRFSSGAYCYPSSGSCQKSGRICEPSFSFFVSFCSDRQLIPIQHGLLACLAGNFHQILQINGNDESKRTRAHLVLRFSCGSSRLYFLSRIPVL
jgi:hypothetical protein